MKNHDRSRDYGKSSEPKEHQQSRPDTPAHHLAQVPKINGVTDMRSNPAGDQSLIGGPDLDLRPPSQLRSSELFSSQHKDLYRRLERECRGSKQEEWDKDVNDASAM